MIRPATKLIDDIVPMCDEHAKYVSGKTSMPVAERMDCFSCTIQADVAADLFAALRDDLREKLGLPGPNEYECAMCGVVFEKSRPELCACGYLLRDHDEAPR